MTLQYVDRQATDDGAVSELNYAKVPILCLLVFCLIPPSGAEPDDGVDEVVEAMDDLAHLDIDDPGLSFVPAAIPVIDPTIGEGLAAGGALLYPMDSQSPDSMTAFGGFYTGNKSWGVGALQKFRMAEDRLRLKGILAYGDLRLKYYGIGGNNDIVIPLRQRGLIGLVEAQYAVVKNLFIGPVFRYMSIKSAFDLRDEPPEAIEGIVLDSQVTSIGLSTTWDTRDSQFWPTEGWRIKGIIYLSKRQLGRNPNYQTYDVSLNKYLQIREDQVLVLRGRGRVAAGNVPFYDLSSVGSSKDIRGYVNGQYRDKILLAGQAEYRWTIREPWGVVAFAGVAQVTDTISDFPWDDLLPSVGVGLRYMVSKEKRINLSVDYARGRDSDGFYFYVGESF